MHILPILLMLANAGTPCNCNKFEITGYTHLMYTYEMDGTQNNYGLFSLPYVRVIFKGKLTEKLSFRVEPDLLEGKIRYAYADLKHIPYVTLRMGLMKVPFGFEFQPFPVTSVTPTLTGATKLFTNLGLGADGGIMAMVDLPYTELKAAVLENLPTDRMKGYIANMTVKPVDMVKLGGSYYTMHHTKWYKLYEGYIAFNHSLINLEGNYIYRDNRDDNIKSYGFYVQAYRKFDLPMKNHYICPAVKFGSLEPDDVATDDKSNELWLGFNWGYGKHIRIMSYFNINMEETNEVDNNKLVVDVHFTF
jgi:hypothetical protein